MIHASHRRMKVVSGFFGIDEWPIVIIRVLSPPLSTALTILPVLDLSPGSNSWGPECASSFAIFHANSGTPTVFKSSLRFQQNCEAEMDRMARIIPECY
jgi:hypothetical protein